MTMYVSQEKAARLSSGSVAAEIGSVQPSGGWVMGVELAWGRLRRWWLRTFRPKYVADMLARRRGQCVRCPHDIIDQRDRKFFRNVCGFTFAGDEPSSRCLPLAEYGRGEVLLFGGGLIALAGILALVTPWASLPPILLALGVVLFFRDPPRQSPATPGAIVAPADGLVTHVENLAEAGVWDGPAVRISIYLSLFDVHINRVPERVRVIEVRYLPGRFRNTWDPRSAQDNEQFWTLFQGEDPPHPLLLVKQIAGPLVSRVVCTARPGEVLPRGTRMGMVKFGSRTDLYLSPSAALSVAVRPGDRVRAGLSIMARYESQTRELERAQ
jgi:phosphatidylserine decarboxylase